jgi:prepilin-type N-terminal cleavage/methylation domain-containing protein
MTRTALHIRVIRAIRGSPLLPAPLRRAPRAGLTMIEVLAVVAILAILAGILIPAVLAVRRHAKVAMAETEVQTLEQAWKKYYAEYQRWPTNNAAGGACVVAGDLAAIVLGTGGGAENPKQLVFLQTKRFDEEGNPVNPWWGPDVPASNCYYYVRFDTDHDGIIPADPSSEPGDNVSRQVIVWTQNPTVPGNDGTIRSWQK